MLRKHIHIVVISNISYSGLARWNQLSGDGIDDVLVWCDHCHFGCGCSQTRSCLLANPIESGIVHN